MGEYASYRGQRIKIGTCEDMLYLRADQAREVFALEGNVNPISDHEHIRFRFPWPDEDNTEPGDFDNPFRRHALWGVTVPEIEHHLVQFVNEAQGYNVCLPCPEGPDADARVHRNGFAGSVFIVQQRWWNGLLVTVCDCACGARYRLETLAMAEPILVALRSQADEQTRTAERNNTPGNADIARALHEIADRITAGYQVGALTA